MKEYKVLGATDKTIQAIRLASTMKGGSWKNGAPIADLKFDDTEEQSQQEQFIHPFQLSLLVPSESEEAEDDYTLIYDHQPVSGVYGINIEEGRIQICSDTQERTYVPLYGEDALPVSGLSSDDEYYIVLALKFDPMGMGDPWDNGYFPCNVYFINSDTSTSQVPAVPGFQTIIIGSIIKETISGNAFFTLGQQQLTSDLFYDFRPSLRPFSITAFSDAFEDAKIKNTYSLADFEFTVREGKAIVGQEEIFIPEYTFTCSQNTYVYCTITEEPLTGYIYTTEQQQQFYDAENKEWNYLVGYIEFNDQQNGLAINQYICQQITHGADTYKVKSISGDVKPDFLSAKFIWDEAISAQPLENYEMGFIGAKPISSEISEPGLTGTQWQIAPIWLYMNIEDYDENKEQYLINKKGNLKWAAGGLEISGSLANWEEIEEVSGKNILRWKPEYDKGAFKAQSYLMVSNKDGNGVNAKSILSGSCPPPSSTTVSSWILAGEESTGIKWVPYLQPSGVMTLSGSIENIFETVETTSGRILRVKTEYDESIDQFHFLNLNEDGELETFTINGDPLLEGPEAIMYWSFADQAPNVLYLLDEVPDDDLILCGDKVNGLYWKPFYGTISGEIYKVKVDNQDPSGGFLVDKLTSMLSSLTFSVESDAGGDYVNIDINPDYFYSEDDSIFIEQTEDGLNICVSSYLVQVADGDVPDYLFDKLTSDSGSISGHIVDNGQYGQVSLDINPGYFVSSDGSISIEKDSNGLDFIISSWFTSVNANDNEPGYLADKIDSTSGSLIISQVNNEYLNIEIDPGYFVSSDGSVLIEDQGDALDFTIDQETLSSTVETIIENEVSSMISSYVQEHFQELISSYFPSGAGLLYINNGELSVIPIGNGVAVGANGTLTFEEPEDCD